MVMVREIWRKATDRHDCENQVQNPISVGLKSEWNQRDRSKAPIIQSRGERFALLRKTMDWKGKEFEDCGKTLNKQIRREIYPCSTPLSLFVLSFRG
jgi:hypothetical protein